MIETRRQTTEVEPALERQKGFNFGAVDALQRRIVPLDLAPALGPLAAFVGTFTGKGFNTIFRPNLGSPTPLPKAATGPDDNILELNLTCETLSFSAPLGTVPNRGEVQPDLFLNAVPYLQTINDITDPHQPVGIHFEPGLWLAVPPTSDPAEGQTVARLASIPHGTTIDAQGTSQTVGGPPTIPPVSIIPTLGGGGVAFPSLTAANGNTFRIPQDLTSFIAAGSITQAMLDDPNVVLRNAIAGQTITSTTIITIATDPSSPLFGGGVDNIAFLDGDAALTRPNAQTTELTATFWIETVLHRIIVPPIPVPHPVVVRPEPNGTTEHLPEFELVPPRPIEHEIVLNVTSTQIQYSQRVVLNFNGLLWPHVSVATLIPNRVVHVPPTVW